MLSDPDRATDWIAIGLSTIVCVSLWGLFIYEYAFIEPFGEANQYMMMGALGLTAVAAITLFGYEKIRKAVELKP